MKSLFIGALTAVAVFAACTKTSPYMTLEEKEFNVSNKEETITLKMASNTYYRINNDNPDWLDLQEVSRKADTIVYSVNIPANPLYEERMGTIRFIGDGVTPLKVKIKQAACHNIGINPTEATVASIATSQKIVVFAEGPWTATSNNPNFTIDPSTGSGDAEVTVTFPRNTAATEVKANITFKMDGTDYVCALTQKASVVVDLSAAGTANCYIVSESGEYKFKATRGTGIVPACLSGKFTTPLAIDHVGVLWSTYNTATAPTADFLTELELKGTDEQYISFIVPETVVGSSVIAAYDNAGKIIWSWHIWFTPKPGDVALTNNTWMDRNLGAAAQAVLDQVADPTTVGFFYSWGRKDPFRSASSFEADPTTALFPFMATKNAEGTEWTYNTKYANAYLIDTFIEEPMKYIEDSKKFWVAEDASTKLTTLWNAGEKTMFDPCPAGYCVPSKDQLATLATDNGLATTMKKADEGSDYRDNYIADKYYFKFGGVVLPLGGAYTFNNDGNVVTCGTAGRYCASEYSSGTNTYWININASAYNVNNAGACPQGAMVRCVKIK